MKPNWLKVHIINVYYQETNLELKSLRKEQYEPFMLFFYFYHNGSEYYLRIQ